MGSSARWKWRSKPRDLRELKKREWEDLTAKSSSKTRTRRSEGRSGEKEVQRRGMKARKTKMSFDIATNNTATPLSTASQSQTFTASSSTSSFINYLFNPLDSSKLSFSPFLMDSSPYGPIQSPFTRALAYFTLGSFCTSFSSPSTSIIF